MIANAEVMNAFLVFESLDGDKLEVPFPHHGILRSASGPSYLT